MLLGDGLTVVGTENEQDDCLGLDGGNGDGMSDSNCRERSRMVLARDKFFGKVEFNDNVFFVVGSCAIKVVHVSRVSDSNEHSHILGQQDLRIDRSIVDVSMKDNGQAISNK